MSVISDLNSTELATILAPAVLLVVFLAAAGVEVYLALRSLGDRRSGERG
jgi:hypothetical protein